jgi:hypothetical protein
MNRKPVVSSNIASIGYESGTLEVEFTSGHIYQYSGVPSHIHHSLLCAFSKGGYFSEFIKDKYPTTQIS